MGESNAVVEKSLRSVFVGNIPYDVTEEKLRDIFGQVGPVLTFKLMYDRESGKPKGYGFCEYKDQETALSAMRNLNAFEIGGRPLRVDNACTEKSRMEMQSLMQGSVVESPYGADVDPNKAPEAISNAVASLPPEQMYELMRQMKLCVRNNPAEARTMLMSNPQLAYALLQAQVVMRIIDPKIAVQILHGSRDGADPIGPNMELEPLPGLGDPTGPPPAIVTNQDSPVPMMNGGSQISHGPPPPQQPPPHTVPPAHFHPQNMGGPPQPVGPPSGGGGVGAPHGPPQAGVFGPGMGGPPPIVPAPQNAPFSGGDFDLRQMANGPPAPWRQGHGPGSGPPQGAPGDFDMRLPPANIDGPGGPPAPSRDNFNPNMPQEQDFEGRFNNRENNHDFDQRDRFHDGPNRDRDRDQRENFVPRDSRDNRDMRNPSGPMHDNRERERDLDFRGGPPIDGRDPRGRNFPLEKDFRGAPVGGPPQRGSPPPGRGPPSNVPPIMGALPPGLAGQDQEKASLIMQVLQLSDEQIQMLPPEQQSSILQLKDQIQRSST